MVEGEAVAHGRLAEPEEVLRRRRHVQGRASSEPRLEEALYNFDINEIWVWLSKSFSVQQPTKKLFIQFRCW